MAFKTRRQSGTLAKSIGAGFENIFQASCNRHQVIVIRIPDGARTYRDPRTGKPQLARVKSPFDFLITAGGQSAVIDTKTVDSNRIGYAFIDENQMRNLLEAGKSINAGYVVWFRKIDAVVFFSAFRLRTVFPGEGLGIEDGLHLGTGGDFNVRKIFEWIDDGIDKESIYQQKLL